MKKKYSLFVMRIIGMLLLASFVLPLASCVSNGGSTTTSDWADITTSPESTEAPVTEVQNTT